MADELQAAGNPDWVLSPSEGRTVYLGKPNYAYAIVRIHDEHNEGLDFDSVFQRMAWNVDLIGVYRNVEIVKTEFPHNDYCQFEARLNIDPAWLDGAEEDEEDW